MARRKRGDMGQEASRGEGTVTVTMMTGIPDHQRVHPSALVSRLNQRGAMRHAANSGGLLIGEEANRAGGRRNKQVQERYDTVNRQARLRGGWRMRCRALKRPTHRARRVGSLQHPDHSLNINTLSQRTKHVINISTEPASKRSNTRPHNHCRNVQHTNDGRGSTTHREPHLLAINRAIGGNIKGAGHKHQKDTEVGARQSIDIIPQLEYAIYRRENRDRPEHIFDIERDNRGTNRNVQSSRSEIHGVREVLRGNLQIQGEQELRNKLLQVRGRGRDTRDNRAPLQQIKNFRWGEPQGLSTKLVYFWQHISIGEPAGRVRHAGVRRINGTQDLPKLLQLRGEGSKRLQRNRSIRRQCLQGGRNVSIHIKRDHSPTLVSGQDND